MFGNVYPNKKFKRIIYIGARNKKPTSLDIFEYNINCIKTIEEEIMNPSYKEKSSKKLDILPILVVWENSLGERMYAEVV